MLEDTGSASGLGNGARGCVNGGASGGAMGGVMDEVIVEAADGAMRVTGGNGVATATPCSSFT